MPFNFFPFRKKSKSEQNLKEDENNKTHEDDKYALGIFISLPVILIRKKVGSLEDTRVPTITTRTKTTNNNLNQLTNIPKNLPTATARAPVVKNLTMSTLKHPTSNLPSLQRKMVRTYFLVFISAASEDVKNAGTSSTSNKSGQATENNNEAEVKKSKEEAPVQYKRRPREMKFQAIRVEVTPGLSGTHCEGTTKRSEKDCQIQSHSRRNPR